MARKAKEPKHETGRLMKTLAECPMNHDAIELIDAADVFIERLKRFANHPASGINDAVVAAGFDGLADYRSKGKELLDNVAALKWVLTQFVYTMECSAFPVLTPEMYEALDEPTAPGVTRPTMFLAPPIAELSSSIIGRCRG